MKTKVNLHVSILVTLNVVNYMIMSEYEGVCFHVPKYFCDNHIDNQFILFKFTLIAISVLGFLTNILRF